MKTSVACCTYNGAAFLHDQLRSIVDQTVRPDEIVIVDDRSTDASAAIAARFASDVGPRIEVVVETNATNRGVVANFQRALSLTTGDLVFLCDQDDVWHPSKVETMKGQFEARPDLLLLHTDARLIDDAGQPLPHSLFEALEFGARERRMVRDGSAFAALLVRNLVTGATAALRRSVFDAAVPFPDEWVHDEWLAIVAATFGTVDYLDARSIDYRQHEANQIGMQRLTIADKLAKLRKPRADFYAKRQRRIEVLLERLHAMGAAVPQARIVEVTGKLAHSRVRATLPRNRVARIVPIAREVVTGRYGRYSSGVQGIVRDCLEPA